MNSSKYFYIPERFKGRTGYQIFVDRFYRENLDIPTMLGRTIKKWDDSEPNWQPSANGEYLNDYFYGGDLKGIISKLEDIKEMGFDLIYLSPISKTQTSHHYDVGNQMEIDPFIGEWSDFRNLCEKSHEMGILIAVDLVFNHMGNWYDYFQDAMQNVNSKYRGWFEWAENGTPIFWYGFKNMPQCNKFDEEYQIYAQKVLEKYVEQGADAIRLDLGEVLPKEFMMCVRNKAKTMNPEALIVNEMWDLATKQYNPQIDDGEQADSVMNYPMADAICRWVRYGNYLHFVYTQNQIFKYPIQVQDVLWNFLDSHDTPRALNMLASEGMEENPFNGRIWDIEKPWRKGTGFDTYAFRKWEAETTIKDINLARKRLMLASLIQYVVKGIPVVFSGTEVGVTGYKDPFNRKPYPWGHEDESLKMYYMRLGKMRKENADILSDGSIKIEANEKVMTLVRRSEKGTLYVALNRTDTKQKNPIGKNENVKEVFNLNSCNEDELMPYGAIIYRSENE